MEQEIKQFYIDQFNEHGDTPKGVGWWDEKRAESRYETVAKMLPENVTVVEYGPGNGIYSHHLWKNRWYGGVEPMEPYFNALKKYENDKVVMINASIEQFTNVKSIDDVCVEHDYGVSIGVFALKLNMSNEEYLRWCYRCITNMLFVAKKGIIFNAFQDKVDYFNEEQFYFNIKHLMNFVEDMGYDKYELIVKPENTPHEFYLKIMK